MAIRPLPPAHHQIDNVLSQLANLRVIWDRISPSRRVECLKIAIDRLDRLAKRIDAGTNAAPGFTKTEKTLLGLFATAFLVGASVQVGVHLGRHSCPAPSVARVGP